MIHPDSMSLHIFDFSAYQIPALKRSWNNPNQVTILNSQMMPLH